jgi:hypothetical protein
MNEKVWVIDDPDEHSDKPVSRRRTLESPVGEERNPALAFSLSIILWGGGQFYNGHWKEGAMFLLLMVNFIAYTIIGALFRNDLKPLLELLPISPSMGVSAILVLIFAGLCIWLYGARRAYRAATQQMAGRFEGVTAPLLPPFCSLLVPGWGQFLNGQSRKGLFFLFVACAGFFTAGAIPGIFFLWESFEPSALRVCLEWALAGCLAFSPVLLLLWLCGVHDALKVSLDDLKKESVRERMACAWNRVKMHGWQKTVLRGLIRFAFLGITLAVSVAIASRYFPRDFYLHEIERVQHELKAKHMTVIPHLIDRALAFGTKNDQNQ